MTAIILPFNLVNWLSVSFYKKNNLQDTIDGRIMNRVHNSKNLPGLQKH